MQDLQNQINVLQNVLTSYLEKPTKAQGTSLRKALMNMSKSCSQSRKDVLETQKAMPKKTRSKKGEGEDEVESNEENTQEETQQVEEGLEKPKLTRQKATRVRKPKA
jgi:pantothenate synthetase